MQQSLVSLNEIGIDSLNSSFDARLKVSGKISLCKFKDTDLLLRCCGSAFFVIFLNEITYPNRFSDTIWT